MSADDDLAGSGLAWTLAPNTERGWTHHPIPSPSPHSLMKSDGILSCLGRQCNVVTLVLRGTSTRGQQGRNRDGSVGESCVLAGKSCQPLSSGDGGGLQTERRHRIAIHVFENLTSDEISLYTIGFHPLSLSARRAPSTTRMACLDCEMTYGPCRRVSPTVLNCPNQS